MNLLPERLFTVTRSPECRTSSHQRGVALVITLILLAVITTLAIAFLGITHRETGAVDSMARTTDAEMAADSALERSKAEIAAVYPLYNQPQFVATNGPSIMGPEMMVSICCQNYDARPAERRTIPYERLDPDQRITNRYDSAPSVFVQTNRGAVVPGQRVLDDRFFVDLNRNEIFEESGFVTNTTDFAAAGLARFQTEFDAAGNPVVNWRIGDPQWIGLLQNPRRVHGPGNRFIGRYAFMVLPAGRSLDLNWIHNQAIDSNSDGQPETFFRNQGVGGWEMNMAGFLADLNANYWGDYRFDPYALPSGIDPGSAAFNGAREFFRYRHSTLLDPLTSLQPDSWQRSTNGLIDLYGDGPLSFGELNSPFSIDDPYQPWPGADSRRRFFSVHDLFDGAKLPQANGFTNRIISAGAKGNSYDRYTFYRMLSQIGMDSIPEEDEGKIHLNYVNIASWDNPNKNKRLLPTDYIAWTNETDTVNIPRLGGFSMGRMLPELFFLSVVTNILAREYPNEGFVTGDPAFPLSIPVFKNGTTLLLSNNIVLGPLYSARIHQILQQAANILDAMSGSKTGEKFPFYPTVFRPRCKYENGVVYIKDFRRVEVDVPFEKPDTIWKRPWRALPVDAAQVDYDDNVYGVPFIIGARNGFPNFNEVAYQTVAMATRRLMFRKEPAATSFSKVEQNMHLEIKNQFGIEVWNSSTNDYPQIGDNRRVGLFFANRINTVITNNGVLIGSAAIRQPTETYATNGALFAGFTPTKRLLSGKFSVPPIHDQLVLTWTNSISPPEPGGFTNRWTVTVTNNIRFFMVETNASGQEVIIDAVSLGGLRAHFDLGAEWTRNLRIQNQYGLPPETAKATVAGLWNGRRTTNGYSEGINNQIRASSEVNETGRSDWMDYSADASKQTEVNSFKTFYDSPNLTPLAIERDAPFTPYRLMVYSNYWRANDPLVHYTADDLPWTAASNTVKRSLFKGLDIGSRNPLSIPWGGQGYLSQSQDDFDPLIRDSSISGSDYWQFPEGPFANLGWLGRVHRGTPWQTIYFKSDAVGDNKWRSYSGSGRSIPNASSIHPTNDWRLLDYFTASIHPNATYGRLSINQAGLAAWSAALAGVVTTTVTNDPNPAIHQTPFHSTNVVIQPAALKAPNFPSEVEVMLNGINKKRNARPNHQFTKLSDILSVPELSSVSPLLANPLASGQGFDPVVPPMVQTQIYDSDYERIPEQILGLLKVGEPRFVIYGWGQSLKPARLGVQYNGADKIDLTQPLSGPSINPGTKVVNNYQVTGEVATKSVIRVVFPERLPTGQTDYRRPRMVVESFNIIPVE